MDDLAAQPRPRSREESERMAGARSVRLSEGSGSPSWDRTSDPRINSVLQALKLPACPL